MPTLQTTRILVNNFHIYLSGVARRRKVGGGTNFFPEKLKAKKKKKKKKKKKEAHDRVLWIGEGFII